MKDINIIRIHNAVFYAYHGVANGEQDLGGKYEVDLELYLDFEKAAREDSLEYTINYEKVYELVRNIICKQKYYLIETATYKIADEIIGQFPQTSKVQIKVRKYNPPVRGVVGYVESEVIKCKN
jgi:7,8-dihydroneopterin aldolase/epimerase/oxygenase